AGAGQAGADRRRHRRLCHPGQSDRLAHRAGVVALPALGRPVRAHVKGRSMLVLDRVGKTYPNRVRALDGLSLAVAPGEILVTIGGSGCGTSTMLRAISGLDTPTQGKVVLDGTVITAPHEKIGIVFQEPRLLPWLRVADNVGFGLEQYPNAQRRARVAGALDRVGLAEKARVWPRELSGGQAQRVAIARALVPRPQVLLLDEPFSPPHPFPPPALRDHLL